jgi:hypothetical protein
VGENKLTIYIHFVHCQKYKIYIFEFFLPVSQRVKMNYIFSDNIYMYCIYRGMSKAPKKLSNCLKRTERSVVLIVFECVLCEVRAYKLISINAVTVSYRRSTWIRKLYLFWGRRLISYSLKVGPEFVNNWLS